MLVFIGGSARKTKRHFDPRYGPIYECHVSSSLNAPAVWQTPTVMTVSIPVVSSPKVLVTNFYLVPTVIPMTPSSTNLSFWLPTQFFVTIRFMSVRHLIKDGPTCLSVLTVTPIDRLHDGDGSNGVKGAAEEGKLGKL